MWNLRFYHQTHSVQIRSVLESFSHNDLRIVLPRRTIPYGVGLIKSHYPFSSENRPRGQPLAGNNGEPQVPPSDPLCTDSYAAWNNPQPFFFGKPTSRSATSWQKRGAPGSTAITTLYIFVRCWLKHKPFHFARYTSWSTSRLFQPSRALVRSC